MQGDHLTDEADIAAERAEQMRTDGIAAARRAFLGPSLLHCEDCGTEIPAARQALGGVRQCVDCRERMERGQKLKRN